MTAKEMFEALGYEKQFKSSDTITPIHEILDNCEVVG